MTKDEELIERLRGACDGDDARHDGAILKGFAVSVRTDDLRALLALVSAPSATYRAECTDCIGTGCSATEAPCAACNGTGNVPGSEWRDTPEAAMADHRPADRLEALARPVVGVEKREGIERDIRIAIWNAGMNGGMGQDLSQAFIVRAMAEPTMIRALAALAASPSPVVGDREAIARAYRKCAEINRQLAGTIGAQPEIATDNTDPHTTDRAGMAQEVE